MANGPKKLLGGQAGKAGRRKSPLGAQVSENEERALGRAFGGARTPAERERLRRMLGMIKNPTTAGTSRFGEFDI